MDSNKMTESGYTPLQVKKWRAITYDAQILAGYSQSNSKLYCLTDYQAAWLLANVDYYGWTTRWTNQAADYNQLIDQKNELEYRLMTCVDISSSGLQYMLQQAMDAQIEYLDDIYDGVNPDSINGNAPNDFYSGDGSADRQLALCSAVEMFVRSYADGFIQRGQIALGVTIVAAGVATALAPVGGIIAIVVLSGLSAFTLAALEAFADEDAIADVVCCMYEALNGAALTAENFATALDSCGFAGGSNAQIIADILAPDMEQESNWLTFVNALGNAYVLAGYGSVVCSCFGSYAVDWLGVSGFPSEDGFIYTSGVNAGSPPNNVINETVISANSDESKITYTFTAATTLTRIYLTAHVISQLARGTYLRVRDDMGAQLINENVNVSGGYQAVELEWTGSLNVDAGYELEFRSACSSQDAHQAQLTDIEVEGVGLNPF